jgi:hypothetical protein
MVPPAARLWPIQPIQLHPSGEFSLKFLAPAISSPEEADVARLRGG